jgi:hypothetical protein
MATKITSKRFIDSIHSFGWRGLSIENYWNCGKDGHNAVFLNYKCGRSSGGEYVKVYCDANLYSYPNLKIQIYLLNRENNGKQDFLLKEFDDWEEYKHYVETELFNSVKELNDTRKVNYR